MPNYHYVCEDVMERKRKRMDQFLLDLKEYCPAYFEDNGEWATEDDIYRAMHNIDGCLHVGQIIQAIDAFNKEFGGPDFSDPTTVAHFIFLATRHRYVG